MRGKACYSCWLYKEHVKANICCRFIQHLQDAGFAKEKQVTFPHKTSWYMRYRRETFEGPAL